MRGRAFALALAALAPGLRPQETPEPDPVAMDTLVRWNLDFIANTGWDDLRDEWFTLGAVGIDLDVELTRALSDSWITIRAQRYLVRRDNIVNAQNQVDSAHDWEAEWHEAWAKLAILDDAALNVRLGHIEVPFGLEPHVDTHFTTRQLISSINLGAKFDWGATLGGTVDGLDYEVGVLRGSGMEYLDRGENYAVAGRIGAASAANPAAGASVYHGDVIDRRGLARYRAAGGTEDIGDEMVRRLRVGADVKWVARPFKLLGEVSVGRDFGHSIVNTLVEAQWNSEPGHDAVYVQGTALSHRDRSREDTDVAVRVGARWRIAEHWEVGAEASRDLDTAFGRERDTLVEFQVRLRF